MDYDPWKNPGDFNATFMGYDRISSINVWWKLVNFHQSFVDTNPMRYNRFFRNQLVYPGECLFEISPSGTVRGEFNGHQWGISMDQPWQRWPCPGLFRGSISMICSFHSAPVTPAVAD